jgi:hypothetical protein
MKFEHAHTPMSVTLAVTLLAVVHASCAAPPTTTIGGLTEPAAVEIETEDRCAPGTAKKFEDDPNAMCATKTETPEEIADTLTTSSLDGDAISFQGVSARGSARARRCPAWSGAVPERPAPASPRAGRTATTAVAAPRTSLKAWARAGC